MIENYLRRPRLDFSKLEKLLETAEVAEGPYLEQSKLLIDAPYLINAEMSIILTNPNESGYLYIILDDIVQIKINNNANISINIPAGNHSLIFAGRDFTFNDNALGDETANSIITGIEIGNNMSISAYNFYGCKISSLVIPDIISSLGEGSFSSCPVLTQVTLSSGLTIIPKNCFSNCTSLLSITIPNNITQLGDLAFDGCTSLTNLVMSSNLTSLGKMVFRNTNISSCNLPATVSDIPESTFMNCTNLASFTIQSTVTRIGDSAFRGCTRLSTINIPASVTTLQYRAFEGCTGLRTAYLRFTTTNQKMTGLPLFAANHPWFYSCNSALVLYIPASVTNPDSTYGTYWRNRANTTKLTYQATL